MTKQQKQSKKIDINEEENPNINTKVCRLIIGFNEKDLYIPSIKLSYVNASDTDEIHFNGNIASIIINDSSGYNVGDKIMTIIIQKILQILVCT